MKTILRRIHLKSQSEEDINLPLTPLIDIIFLVSIFFMVNTSMAVNPVMEVDLPEARNAQIEARQEQVIRITQQERIYLGEREVSPETLVPTLQTYVESEGTQASDLALFLEGDESLSYGYLVGIMDRLRAGGFVRLSLVTERPRRGD